MHSSLPDLGTLKAQAKRLRAQLARRGVDLSHAQTLELVAGQHGFRDWNTLVATADRKRPRSYRVGARVRGRFRGQPATGTILAVSRLATEHHRLTIEWDKPIDVVTFDSFSAHRKRVTHVVNAAGMTAEHLSDGTPLLSLN